MRLFGVSTARFLLSFLLLLIARIVPSCLGFCPANCVCSGTAVRCAAAPMYHVPQSLPSNTTILDLRFNQLKAIPPNVLRDMPRLQTLLLNNNQISKIRNDTFEGTFELRNLYLYKNKIREIESGAFRNLHALEQLYLHFNKLEYIPRGLFAHLPRLERLFLQNNRISRITADSFGELKNLKRLRLDGNSLICDCNILWLAQRLKHTMSSASSAICAKPDDMAGYSLGDMSLEKLHCRQPFIIEHPHDVQMSFGNSVYLLCRVDGDPIPEIEWMKDNVHIRTDGNRVRVLNGGGTLMISPTQQSDIGVYECVARSITGEIRSRPARMTSEHDIHNVGDADGSTSRKPRFLKTPQNLTGQLSATVSFQCLTDPALPIRWIKNSHLLSTDEKYTIADDNTLYIRDINHGDEGAYLCEAQNDFGTVQIEGFLTIYEKPTFLIRPDSTIRVKFGTSVELPCKTVASNSAITWTYNGNPIISNHHKKVEEGSLQITTIKNEDSGVYKCIAENSFGKVEAVAEITVVSLTDRSAAPMFIHSPVDMSAPKGSSVEFPCRAEGNPPPVIIWRKNGFPMPKNVHNKRHAHSGSLYLSDLEASDAGIYTCSAINDYGKAEASARLHVIVSASSDREIIRAAAELAAQDVDEAVRKTLHQFQANRRRLSPHELLQLVRFPDAASRQLARAAEVYERTLHLLRKHQQDGLSVNISSSSSSSSNAFSYNSNFLSASQLALIANLSGCVEHRTTEKCDSCHHKKYRSADGRCNNLGHPTWGASFTPFQRMLPAVYEDGFSLPVGWSDGVLYNGFALPSARLVSTKVISTNDITPDSRATHMLMQWGQFLDHDLDHALPSVSSHTWGGKNCKKTCEKAAPCFPIEIPADDPRITNRRCMDVVRSSAVCGSGQTSVLWGQVQPREQINQLTSYIDASQVYGFSQDMSNLLRNYTTDFGLMRTSPGLNRTNGKPLLPFAENHPADCRRNATESDVDCFFAGDIRANEQLGLLAMHTLWLREHNRIAVYLREINPKWDGDRLYEEARKIVGAEMQHITWKHWMPYILGPKGMSLLGQYTGYDPSVNPSILNAFATAALRFGHSLINPTLERLNKSFQSIPNGPVPLMKAFFSPWRLVEEGGVDPLIRGLITAAAKLNVPGEPVNSQLTEHLFEVAHAVALDLAAINIQRGRDHALPSYTKFRERCNLTSITKFDDLRFDISSRDVRDRLQELYGHVENIDLWVGGILEDILPESKVGPTFLCILVEQFQRLRIGDRFWYENQDVFTGHQLSQIRQSSLARIICDNADDIKEIQRDVFLLPHWQGGRLPCDQLPFVDLQAWKDCEKCETVETAIIDKEKTDDYLLDNNIVNSRRRTTRSANEQEIMTDIALKNFAIILNDMEKQMIQLKRQLKQLQQNLLTTVSKNNSFYSNESSSSCFQCLSTCNDSQDGR